MEKSLKIFLLASAKSIVRQQGKPTKDVIYKCWIRIFTYASRLTKFSTHFDILSNEKVRKKEPKIEKISIYFNKKKENQKFIFLVKRKLIN